MEDGLRVSFIISAIQTIICLNPCSCGGWSQSANKIGSKVKTYEAVLILVLVEDGLRECPANKEV